MGDTDPFEELTQLDRVIHEPARLALVTVLSLRDEADFTYLCGATQLSRGNLSAHLSTLETAHIVTVTKGYVGKRPQTRVSLTDHGRDVVRGYWERMGSWGSRVSTTDRRGPR